jgi:hypothetical protein
MSGGDDWQAGDLALCVKTLPDDPFEVGAVRTVTAYQSETASDWPALRFAETPPPGDGGWGWLAAYWRRIPPLTEPETAAFTADLRDCLRTPAKHTA